MESEQILPQGWELLCFPSTIEIRDNNGAIVHAEGIPYNRISKWDLKHGAIRRALEKQLARPKL